MGLWAQRKKMGREFYYFWSDIQRVVLNNSNYDRQGFANHKIIILFLHERDGINFDYLNIRRLQTGFIRGLTFALITCSDSGTKDDENRIGFSSGWLAFSAFIRAMRLSISRRRWLRRKGNFRVPRADLVNKVRLMLKNSASWF